MRKITKKIEAVALTAAILTSSFVYMACGSEKKAETEATGMVDSTVQVPPPVEPDSLPVIDTSASTRPEPRSTRQ